MSKGKLPAGPNIKPGEGLLVCVDGPRAGQWWYLEEWKALRARSQDMEPYLEKRPNCLDYEPLTVLRQHPTALGQTGNILTFRPGWDGNRPTPQNGPTT